MVSFFVPAPKYHTTQRNIASNPFLTLKGPPSYCRIRQNPNIRHKLVHDLRIVVGLAIQCPTPVFSQRICRDFDFELLRSMLYAL